METRASIVLASHLSDLQIETTMTMSTEEGERERKERIALRLDFLKYLNFKLKGDFSQEIDPDKMFKEFKKERFQ